MQTRACPLYKAVLTSNTNMRLPSGEKQQCLLQISGALQRHHAGTFTGRQVSDAESDGRAEGHTGACKPCYAESLINFRFGLGLGLFQG